MKYNEKTGRTGNHYVSKITFCLNSLDTAGQGIGTRGLTVHKVTSQQP
jgi:hypothetical protein